MQKTWRNTEQAHLVRPQLIHIHKSDADIPDCCPGRTSERKASLIVHACRTNPWRRAIASVESTWYCACKLSLAAHVHVHLVQQTGFGTQYDRGTALRYG